MVHTAHRGITQDLDASDLCERRRTKNVIDAAIVDGGIAGCASQIAKLTQDTAIRFTVVFQVVGIKIRFVRSFELEVEISGDENFRRLRSSFGPIDEGFRVGSSPGSI